LTGLGGAHGMLSILMSQLRVLRKASKGNNLREIVVC